MTIPFLSNIDMNLNQLLNAITQQLASDPVSPTEGQFWYNTTTHLLKYYNGSATIVVYDAATAATASKLVLRDSSGDFAAHYITAAKVTGLSSASADSDAPTYRQVLDLMEGLDWKQSVRFATTTTLPAYGVVGNVLTASSNGAFPTTDGIDPLVGESILVKDEAGGNQKYNGIYTFTAVGDGSNPYILTRRSDANASADVTSMMTVPVSEGSANGNTAWRLTTSDAIVLNTTALAFTLIPTTDVTAGAGLTKTGSTIDIVTASSSRIVVNADSIDLATTGVSAATYVGLTVDAYGRITAATTFTGSSSIVTVGTIGTGTWQGTAVAIGFGGTGATTKAAAFDALSPMSALGDTIHGGAAGTGTRLAGNTTTTKKFKTQTGDGSNSAAPAWATISLTDIPSGVAKSFSADVGDGSTTAIVVTHNLGTRDVVIQVRDNNTPYSVVLVDAAATTTNTATITFAAAPASARYRVIIHA